MKIRHVMLGLVVSATAATLLGAGAHQYLRSSVAADVLPLSDVPKRDVAIVLGAGLAAPGVCGPVLVDRLDAALTLYKQGRVKSILVSGDNDGIGIDEVNPMRQWLVKKGVPSSAIYMDHAGFRTNDTMQRARHVFDVESAVIVTQPFHIERSVFLAKSVGIDAVGFAAPLVRWRQTRYARVREVAARVKAVADVTFGVGPRFLGTKIPIGVAPASATHD